MIFKNEHVIKNETNSAGRRVSVVTQDFDGKASKWTREVHTATGMNRSMSSRWQRTEAPEYDGAQVIVDPDKNFGDPFRVKVLQKGSTMPKGYEKAPEFLAA